MSSNNNARVPSIELELTVAISECRRETLWLEWVRNSFYLVSWLGLVIAHMRCLCHPALKLFSQATIRVACELSLDLGETSDRFFRLIVKVEPPISPCRRRGSSPRSTNNVPISSVAKRAPISERHDKDDEQGES